MKWTDDQQKAISAKPAQIVVSAAAGSGKTQVLSTKARQANIAVRTSFLVDFFTVVFIKCDSPF